jgi:hypothetical protein
MPHKLADKITKLQRKADHCAWLFKTYQLSTELRVAYATGVPHPWRLIEIRRNQSDDIVLRRMYCYENEEALRKSIEERAAWKLRDRALVSSQLPWARYALARRDNARLEEQRRALRESLCVTKAARVVNLPLTETLRRATSKAPCP